MSSLQSTNSQYTFKVYLLHPKLVLLFSFSISPFLFNPIPILLCDSIIFVLSNYLSTTTKQFPGSHQAVTSLFAIVRLLESTSLSLPKFSSSSLFDIVSLTSPWHILDFSQIPIFFLSKLTVPLIFTINSSCTKLYSQS